MLRREHRTHAVGEKLMLPAQFEGPLDFRVASLVEPV